MARATESVLVSPGLVRDVAQTRVRIGRRERTSEAFLASIARNAA